MPSSPLPSLLDEVFRAAKAQGLDQRTLAERAGLSAPTLSRIKGQDDVALSTIVRLAAVVGLRLTLTAADSYVAEVERGELF